MKIIRVDNFDRENRDDLLIAENVHKYYANKLCDTLNKEDGDEMSPNFFRVVDDDYKLFEFEP